MQNCFYFINYKQSNRNKQTKMSRKHTVYELYKNTVSGSKTLLSSVLLKTETFSGVLRYSTLRSNTQTKCQMCKIQSNIQQRLLCTVRTRTGWFSGTWHDVVYYRLMYKYTTIVQILLHLLAVQCSPNQIFHCHVSRQVFSLEFHPWASFIRGFMGAEPPSPCGRRL